MRSEPPRKILKLLYKICLNAAFIFGTMRDTLIKYLQLFYRVESKLHEKLHLKVETLTALNAISLPSTP